MCLKCRSAPIEDASYEVRAEACAPACITDCCNSPAYFIRSEQAWEYAKRMAVESGKEFFLALSPSVPRKEKQLKTWELELLLEEQKAFGERLEENRRKVASHIYSKKKQRFEEKAREFMEELNARGDDMSLSEAIDAVSAYGRLIGC